MNEYYSAINLIQPNDKDSCVANFAKNGNIKWRNALS